MTHNNQHINKIFTTKRPSKLKAIIFDMDGVLVDSVGGIRKSFVKVFEDLWISTEQFKKLNKEKYEGRTLSEQLQMRKKDLGLKQDLDPVSFSREAFKYQLEMAKNQYVPNPDILKFIQDAKDKKIKIAVATSSLKDRAITLLTLVWVYDKLDALISCEDIVQGKPNPESFLKVAIHIYIKPENCVVVEDAVNGIEAAKAAWMKVIAKVPSHCKEEGFKQANMIFQKFSQISLEDLENLF